MPRRPRHSMGGFVFHVLNRAVGRDTLFAKPGDYAAFEKVLRQAADVVSMRLLAYIAMPNHWHLVCWPEGDDDLSEYLRWLTVTHTQRWHACHHTAGTGPLYQGRFKSFPVQADDHFLTVCRYAERNPLRANLVDRAEKWRWSSLWHRVHQTEVPWLSEWPVAVPDKWVELVNEPETEAELEALRRSVKRGAPFGETVWTQETAKRLGLQSTLRRRGRPRRRGVEGQAEAAGATLFPEA